MKHFVAILGGLSLAVTLVAIGFGACTMPQTTRLFSQHASLFATSPYTAANLVDLACATRDFTVDNHTELRNSSGYDAPAESLAERILEAARTSSELGSDKEARWQPLLASPAAPLLKQPSAHDTGSNSAVGPGSAATLLSGSSALESMYLLASVSDEYALDAAAISHLDDCNKLINQALPILAACAALFLTCAVALGLARCRKLLGRMLAVPAVVLLAAFVALGVWAYLDFNSFFAAFHAVFFPQGNWTFSAASLLISMYPQDFWVAMGLLWLALTTLAAIMCIVVGGALMRRSGPGKHARRQP